MARKVMWVDDLDPTKEAVETVPFGIDGVSYEIDLSAENAERLRTAIEPFAQAGRRAGTPAPEPTERVKRTQEAATTRREQLDAIRAWAKKQGYGIADRGRIPLSIQEAFDAAHARRG